MSVSAKADIATSAICP